jgi:hypothetical protein
MRKLILVIGFGLFLTVCLYGQSNHAGKPVQIVSGQISQIDWVGSNITVKWLQPNGITVYDEVTFFVPRDAQITRNGETIQLSEVNIGDNATVEYLNAGLGGLRVVNISIVK